MRAVQTDAGQGAPRSDESAQPAHVPHAIIWTAIIGSAFSTAAFAFMWKWENALGQNELAAGSESHLPAAHAPRGAEARRSGCQARVGSFVAAR
jgi:hypothetical protein